MADKAHIQTDKQLEKMERRLSAIYKQAGKDIKKTAKQYFDDFAAADKQKRTMLLDGRITVEEYNTWRQNKILYGKRYENLKNQIAEQLAHVNESALAYINGELPKTYMLNYNAVNEGISNSVGGYSFELVDKNTVSRIVTNGDKSLLPKPSQKTLEKLEKSLAEGKDIRWNTKKINSEILQGILQGDSMDKIAGRMQRVTDMNAVSAIRNARTMVTGAENAGRMDMLRQANSDGIRTQKKWIAAIDNRTRHWHEELNGVLKDTEEPFDNEYGEIMFPGDPSAHPANVYNCRCTLGYSVEGFINQETGVLTEINPSTQEAQTAEDAESETLLSPVASDKAGYKEMLEALDSLSAKYDCKYLPVETSVAKKTSEEIVSALAGGDKTKGSCASLGLAYIGQRQGWDVLDFRGGESLGFFSRLGNLNLLARADGVKTLRADGASTLTVGKRLLKQCESGKEYYLCVGRHASIVRRTDDGVLQYLELQAPTAEHNGWTKFNGNPGYTLAHRFGCSSASARWASSHDFMINITDSDFSNNEFRSILGYLNTAESGQRKGLSGTIK